MPVAPKEDDFHAVTSVQRTWLV